MGDSSKLLTVIDSWFLWPQKWRKGLKERYVSELACIDRHVSELACIDRYVSELACIDRYVSELACIDNVNDKFAPS